MFDEWNFSPTYYVSVNPLVIEQSIEEIKNIPSIKFLSLNGLRYVKNPQDIIFLKSIYQPSFLQRPKKGHLGRLYGYLCCDAISIFYGL